MDRFCNIREKRGKRQCVKKGGEGGYRIEKVGVEGGRLVQNREGWC